MWAPTLATSSTRERRSGGAAASNAAAASHTGGAVARSRRGRVPGSHRTAGAASDAHGGSGAIGGVGIGVRGVRSTSPIQTGARPPRSGLTRPSPRVGRASRGRTSASSRGTGARGRGRERGAGGNESGEAHAGGATHTRALRALGLAGPVVATPIVTDNAAAHASAGSAAAPAPFAAAGDSNAAAGAGHTHSSGVGDERGAAHGRRALHRIPSGRRVDRTQSAPGGVMRQVVVAGSSAQVAASPLSRGPSTRITSDAGTPPPQPQPQRHTQGSVGAQPTQDAPLSARRRRRASPIHAAAAASSSARLPRPARRRPRPGSGRRAPGSAALGGVAQDALGKTTTINAVALQDHFIRSLNLDLSLGGGARTRLRRPQGHDGDSVGAGVAPVRRRAVKSVDRIQQRIERERVRMHDAAVRGRRGKLAGSGRGSARSLPVDPDVGPGAGTRDVRGAVVDVDTAPDLDFSHEDWICTRCTLVNAGTAEKCVACACQRPDVGLDSRPVTLAQMRGLVKGHEPKLSRKDWEGIARKVGERKDHEGDCAICMEPFGLGEQVLLSCSHVFHKQCLESFERFAQTTQRTCPLCRKANYEKKRTTLGMKMHRQKCAAVLQAHVRGFLQRKRFLEMQRTLYAAGGGDPSLRRAFFAKRLESVGNKVETVVKQREDALDRLFAHLDQQVEKSRNIIDAHARVMAEKAGPDAMGVVPAPGPTMSMDAWATIEASAIVRGMTECPICITALTDGRETVLLSCTHVFHMRCIQAFESFNVFDRRQCPVCRADYRKRVMPMPGPSAPVGSHS